MIIRGTVVKGKGEGKRLGFPTANIEYDAPAPPANGVWAARARVAAAPTYVGAAVVVGMWTLSNGLPSVEVHLLDGQPHDLYGQEIAVELHKKIRDLKKFDRPEDLVMQIEKDIEVCSR